MFGLSEDPQIFQSISLTIELGYKCPIMPLEKKYLFSKATGFRSDFTVVYDFVLLHFSKSEFRI